MIELHYHDVEHGVHDDYGAVLVDVGLQVDLQKDLRHLLRIRLQVQLQGVQSEN